MENLLFERQEGKGVISLNRPEALNALNYATLHELGELLNQIHHDRTVRSVIFRGSGKAFCVGADLKERRGLSEDEVRRNVYKIRTVFDQIENLPQPTIAAVHGYAFGGGFELTLSCDFRYVYSDTKMGLTEVSLGIIPGAGGTIRLPKLIGKAKAKEMILLSKRIDAGEALRLGLANDITDGDVMELAMKTAEELENQAPLAVMQAKYAINKGYDIETQAAIDVEAKAYELLIPTEDRVEALHAFAEKRKPNYKGK